MHAIFALYGKQENVALLLRDMAAQKLQMRFHKEGQPDQQIWVNCQVRNIFGFYEFIFPKEHMDIVLTTLGFHLYGKGKGIPEGNPIENYELDAEIKIGMLKFKPLKYIKKFLRVEDPPEFKTDKSLIWEQQFVSIIPFGIRNDEDRIGLKGETMEGWWHEAI